jgi:putative spermidine/putrescine transport system ATP-binding protein
MQEGVLVSGEELGLIELVSVEKAYGRTLAVAGVSLRVAPSEFVTLLGASGSGKTTTLMMVAGFETPTRGDIFIDGRCVTNVPPARRNLGFVFQHYALFPHMSIFDNLAFPLRVRSLDAATVKQRVGRALELVSLPGYEQRLPSQLSGGQQQRVALARALIYDPPVLLMDEPLGALDKKLREQLQVEIKRIQRELGITVIYVTHDQEEALTMSDRIAVMRNGCIAQIGAPEELYESPVDEFVANFIGEMNFVPPELGFGAAPSGRAPGGKAMIAALRPERVLIASRAQRDAAGDRRWMEGTVEERVYCGEARRFRVRVGDTILVAKRQAGADPAAFAPGDTVHVGWLPSDVKLLERTQRSTIRTTQMQTVGERQSCG